MVQTVNENTNNKGYSDGSELIPAEVAARQAREGNEPPNTPTPKEKQQEIAPDAPNTTGGYTVSEQGLVNNYPVTPKMEKAEYPSVWQQRNYAIQGLVALVFVGVIVGIAILVSLT